MSSGPPGSRPCVTTIRGSGVRDAHSTRSTSTKRYETIRRCRCWKLRPIRWGTDSPCTRRRGRSSSHGASAPLHRCEVVSLSQRQIKEDNPARFMCNDVQVFPIDVSPALEALLPGKLTFHLHLHLIASRRKTTK
ncbi:hypothetical protein EVAR_52296_1 [Eumeta japonica]|uniref:Uncharacterized protein n=1 Tax=Eumeta variegata TaxID=151549 RepID=A0A4C1Y6V3_EUMVA|nr:hypothetical protein EVAR_52296_1 [Eumeta japonica]